MIMNKKMGVAAAVAMMATSVGMANPAFSQGLGDVIEQCDEYLQSNDRSALQLQLTRLLEEDPQNICVDVLVRALGGSPLAQVVPPADPY